MSKKARARKLGEGQAVIMKAGLGSEKQIEALNMWKSIVFLQEKLDKHSMRIWEVRPEHLVEWID